MDNRKPYTPAFDSSQSLEASGLGVFAGDSAEGPCTQKLSTFKGICADEYMRIYIYCTTKCIYIYTYLLALRA